MSTELRSSREECNTPIASSLVSWHGNIVFLLSAGTQTQSMPGRCWPTHSISREVAAASLFPILPRMSPLAPFETFSDV
jgi:hypothetical protein